MHWLYTVSTDSYLFKQTTEYDKEHHQLGDFIIVKDSSVKIAT